MFVIFLIVRNNLYRDGYKDIIILKFNELKEEVKISIKNVKKINYKNYFEYAYNNNYEDNKRKTKNDQKKNKN